MKKLILSAIMATAFLLGTNAQTVIPTDYDSSNSKVVSQTTNNNDEEVGLATVSINYYGFDGYKNYGVSWGFLKPNKIGIDVGWRGDFKKEGNFNVDLGPNYSFKLLGQDNTNLFFTLSVGPSVRIQGIEQVNDKGTTELKTKLKLDMFGNDRLTLNVGKVVLSAGYFLWSNEFKLDKENKADEFNVALGIAI